MRGPKDVVSDTNIDWFIFVASAITVFAVCIPLGLYPEAGAVVLDEAFNYVTRNLGVGYLLFSIAATGLLLYLSCLLYTSPSPRDPE